MNKEQIKLMCDNQITLIKARQHLMGALASIDQQINEIDASLSRASNGSVYVTYDAEIIDEEGVLNGD